MKPDLNTTKSEMDDLNRRIISILIFFIVIAGVVIALLYGVEA